MSFRMYHPEVESTAVCPSQEAYQQSWEHLGWLPLGDEAAYASDILGKPIKEIDDLKADELKRLIRYRNHELPSGNKKDDLLAAYKSIFTDNPKTEAVAPVEQPTPGFVPDVNNPARDLPLSALPDSSGLPSEPQTEGNN